MIRDFEKYLLILGVGLLFACQSEVKNTDDLDRLDQDEIADSFGLRFNYENEFQPSVQHKLESWMDEVYAATQATLGQYPFDVHVHFYSSMHSSRPVSFGLAKRKDGINSVSLYVNPKASLEELLADWTAPHELSHLSIPFLGKSSKWFSEGYATFLSRQIMMDMGYYTQESFDSLYLARIKEAAMDYNSDELTFIERSNELASNHQFSSMYWGSASFLFTIDKQLRALQDRRFVDILVEYQQCCRTTDKNLKDVIRSFDQLIGFSWCNDLMVVYRNKSANEALKSFN